MALERLSVVESLQLEPEMNLSNALSDQPIITVEPDPEDEQEEIATLEPYELFNALQFPENLLVLDLRTRKQFSRSHVKGAVNLNIPSDVEKITLEKCDSTSLDKIRKRFGAVVIAYSAKGIGDPDFARLFKKFKSDPQSRRIKDFYMLKTTFDKFANKYSMMVDEESLEQNIGSYEEVQLTRGLSEPIYVIPPDSNDGQHHLSTPEKPQKKKNSQSISGLSLEIDYDEFSEEEETQKYPSEILPGKLWLGNKEHASSNQILSLLGITHIVNCTKHLRNFFKRDKKYMRVDLHDDSKSQFINKVDDVINFIDDAFTAQGKVLIHCQAGVSRSAALTMAYLIKTNKTPLKEAYDQVQAQRRIVKPNENFLNQLESLEKTILGQSSRLRIGARLRKSPSTDLWEDDDKEDEDDSLGDGEERKVAD